MATNPNEGKHPILVQAEALVTPVAQQAQAAATQAAQAVAQTDNGSRVFQAVSKTATASPTVATGASAALSNVRTSSTFVLSSLLAETLTAATALTVTIKVGYTPSGGSFTPVVTKAIALASLAAVNNIVNLLALTATASTPPRFPAGVTPQVTVSDGTFNFVAQFTEMVATS